MNKQKMQQNKLQANCAISGEPLAQGQGKCANALDNNTMYYWQGYEDYFDKTTTSEKLINAILTCVCNNATIKVNNNVLQNYKTKEVNAIYKIYFNNDIVMYCNGNNANVKKYFNQLTTYKKAIKKITYKDIKGQEVALEDINDYAPYIRQKYLYKIGLSYNPDSKTTIKKVW